MRKLATSLLAVGLVACFLSGSTQPAQAYALLGCKSVAIEANNTEYHNKVGLSSSFSSAVSSAASAWNSKPVNGYLASGSNGYTIAQGNYAWPAGRYALTSWTCSAGGYFSGRAIALHTTNMGALSTENKKKVVVHEFGHAMGLDHTSLACGLSIMLSNAATTCTVRLNLGLTTSTA